MLLGGRGAHGLAGLDEFKGDADTRGDVLTFKARGRKDPGVKGGERGIEQRRIAADGAGIGDASLRVNQRVEDDLAAKQRAGGEWACDERKRRGRGEC